MDREQFQTDIYTKPYVRRWPSRHVGTWMWRGNMPVMPVVEGGKAMVEKYNCYYNPRHLPVIIGEHNDHRQTED